MDKDRIIGSGKQIMGSVKEVVGRLIGDAKLQTDGRAEQREGKVQNDLGSAKDSAGVTGTVDTKAAPCCADRVKP